MGRAGDAAGPGVVCTLRICLNSKLGPGCVRVGTCGNYLITYCNKSCVVGKFKGFEFISGAQYEAFAAISVNGILYGKLVFACVIRVGYPVLVCRYVKVFALENEGSVCGCALDFNLKINVRSGPLLHSYGTLYRHFCWPEALA